MNSPISRIDHIVRPSGRVFHGWWLVLGAAGIQLLSGALMMHSFGAYTVALQSQFGWSKTALSGAFALTRAESGLLGPLQGWLVDRFGPRPVLRWGLIIFSVGFALFALTDTLLVFYIAWALIALGSSLGGFATLTVAIVNWFDQHRAKAVAVSQLGFSLGGMGVTLVILSIELVGWRWTAAGSAIVVLLVGLPLVQLVHHRPENVGEIPDGADELHPGDEPHPVVARRRPRDRDLTPAEAMRTRAFWYISVAHALALLTVSAVTAHLIPHVTEGLGFTPIQAGFAVMLMTATQTSGQLLGGWLGDHFDKRLLCVGCMLGHASGFALLAFATDWGMVIGFAVLNGLAWGVRGPLMVALRADYFGATSFGTIMGFSSLIAMFGMAFGALFAGVMADIFGDYVLGFAILAAGSGLGAILFALCKRPPR